MLHPEYKGILIVYSPLDGGWYGQQPWGDWKVSKIFETETQLKKAIDKGTIKFVNYNRESYQKLR